MSSRDADRLSDEQAGRAAITALRRRGIEDPIEPLRASANHVFRAGDVVVRVAPPSADVAGQVALARWLRSEGLPVAAPVDEPELVENAHVSLWEHIRADAGRPIDFEQLGAIVARLHRIAPARVTSVVDLPFFADASWLAVEENLALAEAASVVEADGLAALRRECIQLRGMIINGARDPVCAAEAKTRMRYWLGDPDAPSWTPL